jgi:tetratricopeptide (TPR) repeat protein
MYLKQSPYDLAMPRAAFRPSPTLARLLRTRREELGLSVRDVEARTAALGDRVPIPTLVRIEQGQQEPGVRRMYTLLRIYGVPLSVLPDLLELDDLASGPPPTETDPKTLLRLAKEHWERGEITEGLTHVFALRMLSTAGHPAERVERQRALLAVAVAASSLGRLDLAHQIVSDVLREPPEPELRTRALIQAAINWLDLGSADMALAVLHRAESMLAPTAAGDRALILHVRANVSLGAGDFDAADQVADLALAAYGDAQPSLAAGVLGIRIKILLGRGRARDATEVAQAALTAARRRNQRLVVAERLIDLGWCALELGKPQDALAALEEGLATALLVKKRGTECRAHFWLWKTCLALKDEARARLERDAALLYAKHLGRLTHEGKELVAISQRGGAHAPRPKRHRRPRP